MSDVDRRKEAQEAMAGPERQKRIHDREVHLAERRKEAAAAMEGPQQRLKRITREKGENEKEAAEHERESAQKKAEEMTALRKKENERLRLAEEESKRKTEEVKLEEIRHSEETIAEIKKKPITLSSLRTFKGDMARAIARGASQTSIVLAEEERRRAMGASIPEKRSSPLRTVMLIGALLLFMGGAGVLGYVFIVPYFAPPAQMVLVTKVQSIIPAEETQSIDITGMRSTQIITALSHAILQSPSSTDLAHIYFTTKNAETATSTRVSTSAWQKIVVPRMPILLSRTLAPEFMYGVLRGESPSGFLIFSVDSPSVALSGMLAWEKTIATDLLPIITGTEGASATGFAFQDRVLRNLDTRILMDENGTPVLLYSVLSGKKYVIITRDQATFDELINRLASPNTPTVGAGK